jgi:hypothetical protein
MGNQATIYEVKFRNDLSLLRFDWKLNGTGYDKTGVRVAGLINELTSLTADRLASLVVVDASASASIATEWSDLNGPRCDVIGYGQDLLR